MDFTTDTRFLDYLTLIMSSPDVGKIDEAWNNLIKLEEECGGINLIDAVKIIINDGIKNVEETPRLLDFFAHAINENPFEVIDAASTTKNRYTNFLRGIVAENENLHLLCLVIEKLMAYRSIYLPNFESIANFCKAIVHCLSLCAMPDQSNKVSDFKEKTSIIKKYLSIAINFCDAKSEQQKIILVCTDTLYKLITETDLNSIPGAALAVVIQLVEPILIPDAVHLIITGSSNDEQLSRLVTVLCKWLIQWLKFDTLSEWIEKFIEGLHNERRFSALNSVSDNCLRLMLIRLMLPMARTQLMPFVHSMLVHMGTPTLFRQVMKNIENVFKILANDPSQSALNCAQDLVNCVNVLMTRFPDDHCYESLKNCLPLPPQLETVLVLLKSPKWIEHDKIIISNYHSVSESNKQIGLNNLGNTCYMNSVLQALVMTPQFCEQILAYDEISIGENCILHELQRLFALLLYSQRPCLSPTDFLRASRPSYFTQGQQHDSAEFLCHLLDVLYEQERIRTERNISDSVLNDISSNKGAKLKFSRRTIARGDNNSNPCDTNNCSIQSSEESNVSSISESSLVYRVFGGESNTSYQCNQCHTSSHNNDHYWELQLSFPEEICSNREVTLKDLINYYLTPEKLTGDNMYHCDRCNSLCEAHRIIKILRAPAHLILTLKHFHYNINSRLRTKLFHKVTYNETIQIPVLNNGHNDAETYQLYAAVVHSGYSMDYGHYFTYARDRTKKWYKFNDSCVFETSLDEFFQLRAPYTPYILFYEKITNNVDSETSERPVLATLSKNIRNIVAMDMAKYQSEQKNCDRNRITQSANDDYYQVSTSLTRQRDNSDDDNPPPTNCRDSVDIQPNRFFFN